MKQLAQFNPGEQLFHNQQTAGIYGTDSFTKLISSLLPNVLVGAGVIFFLLILAGGFGMVVGAGKEANPQAAAKSKAAITFALIGFLLVVSAYFILQLVGTITGVDFLQPRTL